MPDGNVEPKSFAKAVFKEFTQDDLQGLAAEVAYHLLFAVIPLLIFLTALSAFLSQAVGLNDVMDSVNEWLLANLPQDSKDVVGDVIRDVLSQQSGGILSIGGLLALWGARNAMASLMKALNVTFDVAEGRPWWKKQLIAMGLTLALGVGIIGSGSALLLGSGFGEQLANWVGLGDTWVTVWSWVRWPLTLVLVSVMLAFLYWAGPNVHAPFRWLTPGSVITVVLWGLASYGLTFYFQYFAGYTEAYGVLGGVLAFVFWLYVMSLILLLGGEINAVLAKQQDSGIVATAEGEQIAAADSTRQRAAGKQKRDTESPEPDRDHVPASFVLAPFQDLDDLDRGPSAEDQARERLAAEGDVGRARRFQTAVTALGASAVSVIVGTVVGAIRRR